MQYFYYFYKTTNLINNKFYYGVHKTKRINDGYLGSGYRLKSAILKYGEENFKKEILKFFDNEDDMYNYENKIVNKEMVENNNCYNLVIGGNGRGWKIQNQKEIQNRRSIKEKRDKRLKKMWDIDTEEGRERRKKQSILSKKLWCNKEYREKMSIAFSGYNNPDFRSRFEPFYLMIKNDIIQYCCFSNLFDDYIKRYIKKKYNFNFKFNNLFRYYEYHKFLKVRNIKYINDLSTSYNIKKIKTECEYLENNKEFKFLKFKVLNEDILYDYKEILNIISNEKLSDSYIKQYLKIKNFKKFLKYMKYLNLIDTYEKKIRINNEYTGGKFRIAKKTFININKNFEQDYILFKGDIDERYKIKINDNRGRISIMWSRL